MAYENNIVLNILSKYVGAGAKEARKSLNSIQNASSGLNSRMQLMRGNVANTNSSLQGMGAASKQVWRQQQMMNAQMMGTVKASKQQNDAMNKGEQNAREFSFELLGLMFAGMALQKAMFGLLRPAFKAAGVFDVISSTLKFAFLPTALEALDWALEFQSFIMGLDEETRSLLGKIVLLAGVLGTLLFIGGQVGLAVESLGIFLAKGGTAAKLLISPIAGLNGLLQSLLGIGSKVAGWIGTIVGYLGGFLNVVTRLIPGVNAIAGSLGSVLAFLGGLAAGFIAVTTVAQRFGKKIAAVFGIVLAGVAIAVAAVASAPLVIAGAIGVAIGAILGLIWTFRDAVVSAISTAIDTVVSLITAYIQNIISMVKGAINIVKGVVTTIVGLLTLNFDQAKKGLADVWKGVKQILLAPFQNFMDALMGVLPGWAVDLLEGAVGGTMDFVGGFFGGGGGSKTKSPSRGGTGASQQNTVVNQTNNFRGDFSESKKNVERETRRAGERGARTASPFNTGN